MMSERIWPSHADRVRPPAAQAAPVPSGPELVKTDTPEADAFNDPRDYEAVRPLYGRSQDACFLASDGIPYFRPWPYLQGTEGHPQHRSLTLHWPGMRVVVEGENLQAIYPRLMTRRADVWRVYDENRHARPEPGAAIIRSIHIVLESELEGR